MSQGKKNAIDLLSRMRAGNIKGFLRQGHYRTAAKDESKTGRLNMQERRLDTGARTALVNDLVDKLTSVDPEDQDYGRKVAEYANSISVLAMAGVLEKDDLVFDALAFEQPCKVVPKEVQEEFPDDEEAQKARAVPGFRRITVAELLLDLRDMMELLMDAAYIHAEMYHETLMRQGFWRDENKVNNSPYKDFFETDEPAPGEGQEDLVREGTSGASARKSEDNLVDLKKVRDFVRKK